MKLLILLCGPGDTNRAGSAPSHSPYGIPRTLVCLAHLSAEPACLLGEGESAWGTGKYKFFVLTFWLQENCLNSAHNFFCYGNSNVMDGYIVSQTLLSWRKFPTWILSVRGWMVTGNARTIQNWRNEFDDWETQINLVYWSAAEIRRDHGFQVKDLCSTVCSSELIFLYPAIRVTSTGNI